MYMLKINHKEPYQKFTKTIMPGRLCIDDLKARWYILVSKLEFGQKISGIIQANSVETNVDITSKLHPIQVRKDFTWGRWFKQKKKPRIL